MCLAGMTFPGVEIPATTRVLCALCGLKWLPITEAESICPECEEITNKLPQAWEGIKGSEI